MAMHEIICPHCGKAFKIDEAGYADILKQVRDGDFERQLANELELAKQDKRNAVELAQSKAASESQKDTAAKDAEIQELKAKLDAGEVERKLALTEALSAVEKERDALANELELAKQDKRNAVELAQSKAASESQKDAAAKDAEIQELKAKLDAGEVARKLAVTEALSAVEKERDALANELARAKHDKQSASELAEAKRVSELQNAAATKDAEIQDLKAKINAIELTQKLAITEALSAVEKERDELKSGIERAALEKQ